jgi:DNA-binding beta-propeller fold protein YncE
MDPVSTFRYSQTIGFYAQTGRGFNNPVDVALSRDGVLYVINRAGADVAIRMAYKRVTICTLSEEFRGEFSSGGTGDGQLMWPVSAAVGPDDHLYISDEALQCISVFDRRGQFLHKWGVQGQAAGEFDRPAGITFDANGHLLVVDGLNHRVQRYTPDGQFLAQWGRRGSGAGELHMPWGIATDAENNVYVADWRNDRIQKFDAQGVFRASWGTPGHGEGELHRPAGVAVDAEGLLYIADWGNERVQVWTPDGEFLTLFYGAAELSSWATDYFISNQDELEEREKADLEPQVDLSLYDGSPADAFRETAASIEKRFWGPTAVKLDTEGRIYIVDSCRHRIQVYCKDR